MEMSFLCVEKLTDSQNLSLAHTNHNLAYNDYSGKPGTKSIKEMVSGKMNQNLSWKHEFRKLEEDFKSEASEILTKMDKLLNFNKFLCKGSVTSSSSSEVFNKKQPIKKNVELLKCKKKESKNWESKQKLFDLINEEQLNISKKTPESCTFINSNSNTNKSLLQAKEKLKKTHEKFDPLCYPSNLEKQISKEQSKELKKKLLETQLIVDRGVQTARRLTQRVQNMSKNDKNLEKTPSTIITGSSEISLKSWNKPKKNKSEDSFENEYKIQENKESSKTKLKTEKFHQHYLTDNLKFIKNKKVNQKGFQKAEKNVIISVRRMDKREFKEPKLQLQRLPSLNLKGSLQVQKIPNLEISPQITELKVNTGFNILYHDDIVKEKKMKLVENMKKENSFYCRGNISGNVDECFNCAKITRMLQRYFDPKKLDEILLNCNFNVFDPRIDEFVRILNDNGKIPIGMFDKESKNTLKIFKASENNKDEKFDKKETENLTDLKITQNNGKKKSLAKASLYIKELSEELSKKYKEKTRDLEEHHLHLENILQELYEKMCESSNFFYNRPILSFQRKKMKTLTLNKPIVISFYKKSDSSLLKTPKNLSSVTNALKTKIQTKNEQTRGSRRRNKKKSRHSIDRKIKDSRLEKNDGKYVKAKTMTTLPSICLQLNSKNCLNFYSKVKNKKPYHHSRGLFQVGQYKREKENKNSALGNLEGIYESGFEKETLKTSVNENVSLSNEIIENVNKEENDNENKCSKVLGLIPESGFKLEKKSKCVNDKTEDSLKNFFEDSKGTSEAHYYLKNTADEIIFQHEKTKNAKKKKSASELKPTCSRLNTIFSSCKSERTKQKKSQKSDGSEDYLLSFEKQSRKSSSTEVTSLKEVLSALKSQFERTQFLVDKLTINMETLFGSREEFKVKSNTGKETLLSLWPTNGHLNNFTDEINKPLTLFQFPIMSFLSDRSCKTKVLEKPEVKVSSINSSFPPVIWSEKEKQKKLICFAGKTVSETFRKKSCSPKNLTSSSDLEHEFLKLINENKLKNTSLILEKNKISLPLLLDEISNEKSYSDGEIPSKILVDDECSSIHSVGEVISEVISAASTAD